MESRKCRNWDNKLINPLLHACVGTDCDIGNGYSELGFVPSQTIMSTLTEVVTAAALKEFLIRKLNIL